MNPHPRTTEKPFHRLESTLGSLETRLGRIGEALQSYRVALGEAGGNGNGSGAHTDEVPAGRAATGTGPAGNGNGKSVHAGPVHDESLFDELLEQIIKGHHARPGLGLEGDNPREFLHETPDIAVELMLDGTVRYVNPAFTFTFGFEPGEIRNTNFLELVDPEYREAIQGRMKSLRPQQSATRVYSPEDIVLLRARSNTSSHISLEGLVTSYRTGTSIRMVLVMRDLSAHNSLLEQLKESKDNYDALSETITEAILRIDEHLTIVFANSAVRATFGHDPTELRGQPFSVLFPTGAYGRHEEEFRKYFIVDDQDRAAFGLKNTIELLGKHKNRGIAPVEVSFGNSKDYKGRTLTCIIRDITQRKNAERRLRHLAYHDQLTGLGNRDLFNSDVAALLETLASTGQGLGAVLFLDLDGFKQVNDTIGHDAGDELLKETGKRLQGALRQSDTVYRFGGDEFVVVLHYIHQRRNAAEVANKLLAAVRRPYTLAATDSHATAVTVGVSIGIALIPSHGNSVDALTKAADLAMYSAKESGRNQFSFYSETLDARATERWELEQGIRGALERGDFYLHYQPLVNNDGYVQGFEALLRWTHPTRGSIPPGKFIPVAEETGLIVPLGNWVLETAFRDVKTWNDAGHEHVYVAVNLSPKQFEQRDLVDSIGRILERTGADPANIKLEITETCIMSAPDAATDKMCLLKERYPGMTIAIDDFGTGYSSLSYLSRLPADMIKIDLSFVTKLFSLNNEKIVNAIINLAHSLNLEIVAEGVESSDQWNFFNEHQCRTLQGYHFNRPAESQEVLKMIEKGQLAQLEVASPAATSDGAALFDAPARSAAD